MSDPHIHFDADHVPESERLNPHAHTDFDWAQLIKECDGEIQKTKRDLTEEEYERVHEALIVILAWVFGGKDTQGRSWVMLIAARAITIGSLVCPRLMESGGSRKAIARALKISKQADHARTGDAAAYLKRMAKG